MDNEGVMYSKREPHFSVGAGVLFSHLDGELVKVTGKRVNDHRVLQAIRDTAVQRDSLPAHGGDGTPLLHAEGLLHRQLPQCPPYCSLTSDVTISVDQ